MTYTSVPHTPGHIIANIPALLGYYPKNSLVLVSMRFDTPTSTSETAASLGPIVRLDLENIDYLSGAIDALQELGSDGVYIVIVAPDRKILKST